MTIVKNFATEQIIEFQWCEKSFAVPLDMVVSIDILQFNQIDAESQPVMPYY